MVQTMNFKKLEVIGATKEEALSKAPFNIMGDATQGYKLWKKAQTNGITEASIKQFMLDYLAKKSKNVAGIGFSITIDPAVVDTRMNPYSIKDVKNEDGARKYKTTYQLINKATNEILAEVDETKAKAKEVAKKLIINGFKGKLKCKYTKQVIEGEPIAFEAEYTPSTGSHPGTYLVFGIEA